MANLAKTLTGVLGANLQLVRTLSTYDELSGKDLTSATTTYTLKASPPAKFTRNEVNGTTVLGDDLKVIVARLDAPGGTIDSTTDTIIIDGKTYRIISVGLVKSGDSVAAFTLQLRA
jgi:hypothetical protein